GEPEPAAAKRMAGTIDQFVEPGTWPAGFVFLSRVAEQCAHGIAVRFRNRQPVFLWKLGRRRQLARGAFRKKSGSPARHTPALCTRSAGHESAIFESCPRADFKRCPHLLARSDAMDAVRDFLRSP